MAPVERLMIPDPSVAKHDGKRDTSDQRSRAEAEEDEQQDLLQRSFLADVGLRSVRTGWPDCKTPQPR